MNSVHTFVMSIDHLELVASHRLRLDTVYYHLQQQKFLSKGKISIVIELTFSFCKEKGFFKASQYHILVP
jgi:hypothetical protein